MRGMEMGRGKRQISSSGVYHIVNKGVGNQIIFEDDSDKEVFMSMLESHKKEQDIKIFAFCLMENHFHLLILDKENHLSKFMQNLCSEYAIYFNRKYLRCGHLFNDRFKSEAIEDDSYLLTAFRYIIMNPEKAKVCNHQTYRWSSFREYYSKGNNAKLSDCEYVEGLFSNKKEFLVYLSDSQNDDDKKCLEIKEHSFFGIFDEVAKKVIREKINISSCTQIRSFEKTKRNKILSSLRKEGFSIRLLERLTGVSRGIIQKIEAA